MSAASQCDDIQSALALLPPCEQTEQGARFVTHCLYPSFTPVAVYVVRIGDGYTVHDGGGAMQAVWDHGREMSTARRFVAQQANFHQLAVKSGMLTVDVPNREWLLSAILSVANASAAAARSTLEAVSQATETSLKDMISDVLKKVAPSHSIATEFAMRGRSGKTHHFDFAISRGLNELIVVDAVSPHHVSIASKYVAFSDTSDGFDNIRSRLAVHDKPLDADDVSLLQQVADIVPFASLEPGVKRQLSK